MQDGSGKKTDSINYLDSCGLYIAFWRLVNILCTDLQKTPCAETSGGSVHGERANFTGLVLGCIEADFWNRTFVGTNFRRDLNNALRSTALKSKHVSNQHLLTFFAYS